MAWGVDNEFIELLNGQKCCCETEMLLNDYDRSKYEISSRGWLKINIQ